MLTVPKLPQVTNAPAVQAFQSGRGSSDPAAFGFGRGGEAFGRALVNAGGVAGAIAQDLKRDDDERMAKEADVKMSAAVRATLYGDDATPGYLSSQGQSAIDGAKATDEALKKARRDIAKDLNPAAARLFNDVAARRVERARDSIVGHTSRQRTIADAAASTARIAEFSDDAAAAWNNPAAVTAAIAGARLEASDLAAKAGLDAATAASGIEAAETGIHAKVIDSMLANQVPGAADAYFKANKDRIDGKAQADIIRAINAGKNKQAVEFRDEVASAVDILDAGKTPAGLASLRQAVAGTKLAKPLDDAVADFSVMQDFNGLSLPARAAELRALDSKQEVTGTEFRRLQRKAKAYAATIKQIEQGNGLAVAADAGMIGEPVTVDWSKPETLKARARQSELATRGLGVRVAPLTPAEAEGLADAIEQSPAAQTGALLHTLGEGFGRENATAVAAQLAKGKRPEYGPALILADDNPQLATDIILGGRSKREAGGDLEMPVSDKRTAIAGVFQNAFEGTDGEPMAAFIAAGDALYAARRVPGGNLTFDGTEYATALRDASGGVVRFNDRSMIPPKPGMGVDAVQDVVEKLTDANLAAFGNGAPIVGDGTPVPAARLFGRAGLFRSGLGGQLVSVGPGVYRVNIPGAGFLQTEAGAAYELDLRRAMGR